MTRALFGGTAADFVVRIGPSGTLHVVPARLTFWTAKTGGVQITDLLLSGAPVTSVTVPEGGAVPAFEGPDGVVEMWADAGGASRVLMSAQGRQGLPGINAIPAKAAVDAYADELLDDPGSLLSQRLSASYVSSEDTPSTPIQRVYELDPAETDVAPWQIVSKAFANGGGKPDNVGVWVGFNADRYFQDGSGQAARLAWMMGMESGYHNPDDLSYGPEWYLNYGTPDGTTIDIAEFRPLYVRIGEGDTNLTADKWAHVLVDIGVDPEGVFAVGAGNPATGTPVLNVKESETRLYSTATVAEGTLAVRPPGPGPTTALFIVDSAGAATAVAALRVNGAAALALIADTVDTQYFLDKSDQPVLVFNYGADVATRQVNIRGRLDVDGVLVAGSDTDGDVTIAGTANLGGTPPTPTIAGNAARGTISIGTGTVPAAGHAITLTIPASVYSASPTVVLTAANFATSNRDAYVDVISATEVRVGFGTALAASQAVGTYKVAYQILG